ncbi:nucleoside diphosphate kinase regulator [Aquamicrobium sp. LC103]|uniref:nucleoside diphosphate kinase regulator n=1 Tax=Aquamicrobium sp. LC103 TaxID=1120658 RepID=UPI00063EAE9B|nr:nucleoside diphosphate kinase regulator [Aquamicrobium sp. LC103]TKT80240.1 nucleoside diphosphate kinase regulator [Aquamicrobium sp. LC103]
MPEHNKSRGKRTITLSKSDFERLTLLADAIAERNAELSEVLFTELDRAKIIADHLVPETVIRVGSTATYRTETGEERVATLVLPADADIEKNRISVLTPVGVALIGLSPGQSMEWTARDGRRHALTVESVEAPADVAT